MPTFRHLPISRRLWLIVLVAVAMLLAMSVLLLRQSYDDLYAGKVLKTQHVVESALGILKHQHAQQLSGKLSQEQAQQQAASLIRDLRQVSDRLEGNPARYLLGRDAPKEFEPE